MVDAISFQPLRHNEFDFVRAATRRVMNILDEDPVWASQLGKIAVAAAVERSLTLMVKAGEKDEAVLFERVFVLVGGAYLHRPAASPRDISRKRIDLY